MIAMLLPLLNKYIVLVRIQYISNILLKKIDDIDSISFISENYI